MSPQTAATLRWLVALVALQLVLALPDRPSLFVPASFLVVPAELPAIVGVMLAVSPRWRRTARLAIGLALALVLLFKLADIAMFAILGRSFNPLLDIDLVGFGLDLLGRALGETGAVLLVVLAALLVAALVAVSVRLFGLPDRTAPAIRPGRPRVAAGVALIASSVVALPLAWSGDALPLSPWASRNAVAHLAGFAGDAVDLQRFDAALAVDPVRDVPADRLLAGLRGVDVMIVFAESYGRSVVDPATGDPAARTALAEFDRAVRQAGFAARTAYLTSPVTGGQSWLPHATLLSGLDVGNQRRYAHLVASDRSTLVRDFARAGWRTVAVMPAMSAARPSDAFFGHDRFYATADLGYRGAPFNWITMPDQYTLAAFARRELQGRPAGAPAVLAEIALISSHAPWTPVPLLLPWNAVGDGAAFTPYATAGDPPDVVWRDPDRVRAQYRKSIAYVLRTMAAFVAEYGRRDLLIVLLGDHQPVPFVSGDGALRAVPVHVIAGDPALLGALDGWHWTDGAVPDAATPTWPMQDFRARFVAAFSQPGGVPRVLSARATVPGSAATRRQ